MKVIWWLVVHSANTRTAELHDIEEQETARARAAQYYIINLTWRLVGMLNQHFPVRFSIDSHKFSAIATDSLHIEEIEDLKFLWINSGERYDILVNTKKYVGRNAFKMRFITYSNFKNESSAVCSIAWLKYTGQIVDLNYNHRQGKLYTIAFHCTINSKFLTMIILLLFRTVHMNASLNL